MKSLLTFFKDIFDKADYYSVKEGKQYFAGNRVKKLDYSPGRILAQVQGTSLYNVELVGNTTGSSKSNCSCLSYHYPCKHIIAAILAAQDKISYQKYALLKNSTANQYLKIEDIRDDTLTLSLVRGIPGNITERISATTSGKNQLHALLCESGVYGEFKDEFCIINKEKFVSLIKKIQHLPISGLLSPAGNLISILPTDALPVLRLCRKSDELYLQIEIGDKSYLMERKYFLSLADNIKIDAENMDSYGDYLLNLIFTANEPMLPTEFDLSEEYEAYTPVKGIMGIYLVDDYIITLYQAPLLARFLNFKINSMEHAVMNIVSKEILDEYYSLIDFDKYPAPELIPTTPKIIIELTEEYFSSKNNYLCVHLKFDYSNIITSKRTSGYFFSHQGNIFCRNLNFEESAVNKLYGENRNYNDRLSLPEALDFLFKKLPSLPSDWKIIKNLKHYDYCSTQTLPIKISETDTNWLEISFQIPGKLKSSLNKKMIRDILHKKSKYFRSAKGQWFYLSEELRQSISILYFLGHNFFDGSKGKISPFQVIGLWQYSQYNKDFKLPKNVIESINSLKNFKNIIRPDFSDHLSSTLRPYQKEGVAWLEFLYCHNLSGILCDDMGLGKTLQTLAFLWQLKRKGKLGQCVIVVPTSAIGTWKLEIEKFLPDFKCIALEGPVRFNAYDNWQNAELYIISYTVFCRDVESLSKLAINYLIADEAQFLKNPKTKRSRSLFSVKSERRMALTGTPLENRLSDLWSIFHFLMPGYLGSLDYFRDIYQLPIEKHNDAKVFNDLHAKIKPFLLRRLKDKVEKELPPKTEIPIFCDLTDEQKKIYIHTLSLVRSKIFEEIEKHGYEQSHIHIFSALTKLRQICNHPSLIFEKPNLKMTSGKFEAFKERIVEAIQENHYVIVFSQFTSMLSIIRLWLNEINLSPLYLDGSTKNRAELVKQFEDGASQIFLISLKAGGTALTLTRADYVMHFDPWWNPSVENQATDRAHRIGQKKHVFVYKYYCRGTIEEKVLNLQKKKQQLFNNIMSGATNSPLRINKEDLNEILAI